MEIRTTYKQTHNMVITDKQAYKQHHFHGFLIITSDMDMDEEYAKLMITEYHKQAASEIEDRQASARRTRTGSSRS
eukprot:3411420-Amphidinium_carterae.1